MYIYTDTKPKDMELLTRQPVLEDLSESNM